MNRENISKKNLRKSALFLMVSVVLLIGTTFAWFTDTASTGVNKIQAGNLAIGLEYLDENDEWQDATNKADLFNPDALWEPGHVEYVVLKVSNKGSLALKYNLGVNVVNNVKGETAKGEEIDLAKYLNYAVIDGVFDGKDRAALLAETNPDNTRTFETDYAINDVQLYPEGNANADAEKTMTIAIWMPENVGNEANHNGTDIPEIHFGINVAATQLNAEVDSFGPDYDKLANCPAVAIATVNENGSFSANAGGIKVSGGAGAIDDAINNVSLVVEEADTPRSITINDGEEAVSYEISLKDSYGNKVAANEGQSFDVGVQFSTGLADVKAYHKGNPIESEYDPTTGMCTFVVSDFSPFTFVCRDAWSNYADTSWYNGTDKIFVISTAEELAGLAELVNSGNNFSGKTIKLSGTIDLKNMEWTPINGFTGTFDGQNHIISNLHVYGGDTGKGFGLFGDSNVKEVKDLTIHNAYVYGNSAVAAVVGNGFTSTINNVHVTGLIQIGTTTKNGHIANYNSSYIGGIIGWGYAKVENCSVKGETGSLIGGGRQAGGILGFGGEGKADRVVNCSVENVTLTGTKSIGGIIGWAHYGNNVKNCQVKDVIIEFTGTDKTTIGLITGTTYTNTGANDYNECVDNKVVGNCKILIGGKETNIAEPFNRYATYAMGPHYIKRGADTYIFCETEAQANSIKQDGDTIIKK